MSGTPLTGNESAAQSPTLTLDLSPLSPLLEEKQLPAIIVTPSSPSSPTDYHIAFLASSKEREEEEEYSYRSSYRPALRLYSRHVRAAMCLALPVFIISVHLLVSRLVRSPAVDGNDEWPIPIWG